MHFPGFTPERDVSDEQSVDKPNQKELPLAIAMKDAEPTLQPGVLFIPQFVLDSSETSGSCDSLSSESFELNVSFKAPESQRLNPRTNGRNHSGLDRPRSGRIRA